LGTGGTRASAINAAGQVVGSYVDGSGALHGFLYTAGNYTTLDDPSASGLPPPWTWATGINSSGQIVRNYTVNGQSHGFVYDNGTYTTIVDPLSIGGTYLEGINDAGDIVGFYSDSNGNEHGFLYSGGTFAPIDNNQGASRTILFGINDTDQIVGVYTGGHGFIYSGGTFNLFADPPLHLCGWHQQRRRYCWFLYRQ
jgi:probable HAF family extracellular repeat protein